METQHNQQWQITIDGKAATGKSSCGKLLANKIGFSLLDTGFYYRFLTWLALKLKLAVTELKSDSNSLAKLLKTAKGNFHYDLESQDFFYQQQKITKDLFQTSVVEHLNYLTPLAKIRNFVTTICRETIATINVILVGRDCGVNIVPSAQFKFFLITDETVQNQRRIKQFETQTDVPISNAQIINSLKARNLTDEQRQIHPVKPAADAVIIDNTKLTINQNVNLIYDKIYAKIVKQTPHVMLIGPINAGKSTIFNALIQKKVSIVSPLPMTTRDFVKKTCLVKTKPVVLIDAGGIQQKAKNPIAQLINAQVANLMKQINLFLLVYDGNEYYNPTSKWYFQQIKKYQKPILVILNKIDLKPKQDQLTSYQKLGLKPLITLSAKNKHNLSRLRKLIEQLVETKTINHFKPDHLLESEIKIGIFGQTNAGKSTFFNALIQKNLAFVSLHEHTTTNTVNSTMYYQTHHLTLFDTAGMRRKKQQQNQIEKSAIHQIAMQIKKIDIAILIIDANQTIVEQDKRIARMLIEANLPVILIVNKTDLIKSNPLKQTAVLRHFPHLKTPTVFFCNSLKLTNRIQILNQILQIFNEKTRKLPIKLINQLKKMLNIFLEQNKINYRIFEIKFNDCIFEIFMNNLNAINSNFKRLIERQLLQKIKFKFIRPKFIYKTKKII